METLSQEAIPRCTSLPVAAFRESYLRPHRPVILLDALSRWKAIGKWTPEFFASEFGSHDLLVDGNPMRMRDLIQRVLISDEKNPAPYLRNYPIRDLSPSLLSDIRPLPEYVNPNWLQTRFYPNKLDRILGRATIADVFISGRGTKFPFVHYDVLNSHAFLCQIYGSKSYTLFAPDQTPWLYRSERIPNRSLIDNLDEPDLRRFPLFANARGIRFALRRGEMLFIPAGWWHGAVSAEASITISLSVANSSNWSGLVKDQYRNARGSAIPLYRLAAVPVALYLVAVGLYRSLIPLRKEWTGDRK